MKRVFILSGHPILGRGIEMLLSQQSDLQVIGCATELPDAIRQVLALQPDVVVVDTENRDADGAMVIAHVFRGGLHPCVVSLNLQDNSLTVYHGEHTVVKEVEDFVRAIQR